MNLANLNLAICGHAKHGKSTLAGRLAYELKAISSQQLELLEEQARERGRDFNRFNMIFLNHRSDTFLRGEVNEPDDPSRTNFPSRASLNIENLRLTLIDTPGYPRFLSNIVYGIFLADQAAIVVDIKRGVNIGTESICRIVKAFDIPILAFCVTKIDELSEEARRSEFERVCDQILRNLLEPLGIPTSTPILPVSAISGSGISGRFAESLTPWYDGQDLIGLVRDAEFSESQPFIDVTRFAVEGGREILSPPGVGTVIVGTLEIGSLRAGDRLIAEPASTLQKREIYAVVRSLHLAKGVTDMRSDPVETVAARAIVSLNVPNWKNIRAIRSAFKNGGILGSPSRRPRVAKEIEASIVFFEPDIVYAGKEYRLHPHVAETTARVQSILNRDRLSINLQSEEYISDAGEVVDARIAFHSPCCIEERSAFPRLANFVLRENNRIIGCGKCLRVIS